MRKEQEIFADLAALCASPGYAHAVAHFCFRDHVVGYGDSLKGEDLAKLFSLERLIRTEIATLIGLMVRAPLDLSLPDASVLGGYIERTDALLKELHDSLNEPAKIEMQKAFADPAKAKDFNPFTNAAVMREPIFYGAESAYSFQYCDLSVQKYGRDKAWLLANKGFSPEEARKVVAALNDFIGDNLLATLKSLKELPPEKWSILGGFQFAVSDVIAKSGLPEQTVRAVVDAFTCPDDGNPTFTSLNEFNAVNAFPILRGDDESRILFLYAGLAEALYETPFYWMNGDKAYSEAAMANRGAFTEEFSTARLERVFGADKVFPNIDVWETNSKKKKLGEIDVLVLFGDRAIVVQAKSKKLTLAARKGNDLQLQADFKAAVQDACDQAVTCSERLIARDAFFADGAGQEVKVPQLKAVHPVCVVSDHYPALSFQAHQFLSFKPTPGIEQPLVCDVFLIDVVTEFLETPLRLLSYLELRARIANSVSLSHEIVALGYHLRQNLWLGEHDFIALGDDLSIDVDIAMAARREGVEGKRTPPGILTQLVGTAVGRIVEQIEKRSEPGAVGTGLELLKLSSESANDLSQLIDKITADGAKDGKPHDVTVASQGGSGITVHCNQLPHEVAGPKLGRHCELRKYSTKASKWFGIAILPGSGSVRFGVMLDYPWKRDEALEADVAKMPAPKPMKALKEAVRRKRKIGRNERCPCGSGLKYKKCHLLKDSLH